MKDGRSIYLIRHGHIKQDGGLKRFIGVSDIPLSDTGIRQAKALADWFEDRPVSGVYCSDLSRSVETARAISEKLCHTPVVVPTLHELHMGEWENRTFNEIQARFPEEFEKRGRSIADYTPPGGESFAGCLRRVWPVFTAIVQETAGDAAIVAHAGVNRVLLCRMLGIELNNAFRFRQDYGCLNIIGYSNDMFTAKLLNFVPRRD